MASLGPRIWLPNTENLFRELVDLYRYVIVWFLVQIQFGKKHARVSFSKTIEGRVQFEVFEKLTSVCFSKLHEKTKYYLLIIYMKKLLKITCSNVRTKLRHLSVVFLA